MNEISKKYHAAEKADFRLDLPSPALAKIPRELARLEGETIVSLFRYSYRSSAYFSGEMEKIKWL